MELRRSGHVVRVAPGRSALSAVREWLPRLPYSCERPDSMLLCASRCRGSRLVLDL
ncbi:hypothetical protein [Streptomyces sp. MUM 178J]|uniref:hypothetical protein n=1 Tax=Streptomyces sp. MUM 178J TaxID=2791991 RepID=UPI003FA76237